MWVGALLRGARVGQGACVQQEMGLLNGEAYNTAASFGYAEDTLVPREIASLLDFTCLPDPFTLDRTLESQKWTWESPGVGVTLPSAVVAGVGTAMIVHAIHPDHRLPRNVRGKTTKTTRPKTKNC